MKILSKAKYLSCHQLTDIVSILITVTDKCTFEKLIKERVGNI